MKSVHRTIGAFLFATFVMLQWTFAANLAATSEKLIDFESIGVDVDDAPSGFTSAVTGDGDPEGWRVEESEAPLNSTGGRRVLGRRPKDASEQRSYVCTYDAISAADVDITVFIKALGGSFEQSGGVIVRYQDKDHYYVLRANAKVGNVALLKVVEGTVEKIADRSTAVTLKKWQKLRVVAVGNQFEAFLDDVPLFQAKDDAITASGKVGLWTPSDSEALFDDLRIVTIH